MSKTDSSLPLLAILRFDIPSSSTRTVNATQSYDTISSGLVLGSFTGTLSDKSVAVKKCGNCGSGSKLEAPKSNVYGGVSFNALPQSGRSKDTKQAETIQQGVTTVTLNASYQKNKESTKTLSANNILRQQAPGCGDQVPECMIVYSGTVNSTGAALDVKATKSNTIYYGGITVGLGGYKKWLGKYAVLKINTDTEKAILRIYDA